MKRKTAEQRILDAVAPGLHGKLERQRAKTESEIKFDLTRGDRLLIDKIMGRAKELGIIYGSDPLSAEMDLVATHLNGTTLNLLKFFEFNEFNFLHDFLGIRRHLDRKTGKLKDFFLPRCAR